MRPHKQLEVWRKSLLLVRAVYEISRSWPEEEKFGLTSQARRAAVSIAANIAEGAARQTRKEFFNFLHIAQGSLSELDTLLEIATMLGYRTVEEAGELLHVTSRMLSGLIRSIRDNRARFPRKSSAAALLLLFTVHCSLLTVAACGPKPKGKTTLAVYQEAMGEGAQEGIDLLKKDFERQQPLGYEEPVVPIMVPPETMLIWWAPELEGDGVFVHGHWEQLVVRPWEWNPEILKTPQKSGQGPAIPLPFHPESKPKAGGEEGGK